MKPSTIPTEYALKNTTIIAHDNTLKREAGRKTAIFLIMASKLNLPPLSVTKLSMLGRLKVAAEVKIENN